MLRVIDKPKGRLFAIGDVHGCIFEIEALLNWLQLSEGLDSTDQVIFIGDYIDRGPEARAVIDLLVDFKNRYPATIFLKGNHEDMLLDYLGFGGNSGNFFLKNGGGTTLESYGLPEGAFREDILSRIPEQHILFLRSLDSFIECAQYFFAHAGINPRRTLKRQVPDDLYWIREGFLDENHSFGKPVVFGHTPHAEVVFDLPYKIGIDTGLVYGNKLTCVELTQKLIYQVVSQGRSVSLSNFET